MSGLPKMELSRDAVDFIDDGHLTELLNGPPPDPSLVRDIIGKSLAKQPLTVHETAVLLRIDDPELIESVFQTAQELKETVYGNRIVLFAPLYVGNDYMLCSRPAAAGPSCPGRPRRRRACSARSDRRTCRRIDCAATRRRRACRSARPARRGRSR